MRIAILAAGAGDMICGSCLRDHALARALLRLGHEAVLVPLYTPLRAEGEKAGERPVFYGGINTWLQHASAVFRHTPRAVDWLFDRPGLLRWAGSKGATTSPANVAGLTLSILRGESGPTAKELRRLVAFLKEDVRPEVVTLPNLMFAGAAKMLSQELGCAVVCELTGEDIFLEAMRPDDQARARELIRSRLGDLAGLVATSRYYARKMAGYLGVGEDRIRVVYPGVEAGRIRPAPREPGQGGQGGQTVGYVARVCPEKGLERLLGAFALLANRPGMEKARLHVAGYLNPGHAGWMKELAGRLEERKLLGRVLNHGEVEAEEKWAMLDDLAVLSVPTAYPEAKGLYVLEAWARGVPVVQPRHGSFVELIEMTGGGVLVEPGNDEALAGALQDLLLDEGRRTELGERGRRAVAERFTEEHMAQDMLKVFGEVRS